MVTTLSPNANDTPTRPIPTCGKPAAITALPQPAKVSQNVPMASAAYFFVSIRLLPRFVVARSFKTREQPLFGRTTSQIRAEPRQICRISWLYWARKPASQVDIHAFVWYMPALRVKSQAFAGPSLYQNSYPIN